MYWRRPGAQLARRWRKEYHHRHVEDDGGSSETLVRQARRRACTIVASERESTVRYRRLRWMALVFVVVVGLAQVWSSSGGVDSDFDRPPEATYVVSTGRLQYGDVLADVRVAQVTEDFFAIIDRRPWLGRIFLVQDYQEAAEPAVVLSQRLWRERFDGRPEIVGRTVRLDGRDRRVMGVMPAAIEYPPGVELWIPQTP